MVEIPHLETFTQPYREEDQIWSWSSAIIAINQLIILIIYGSISPRLRELGETPWGSKNTRGT